MEGGGDNTVTRRKINAQYLKCKTSSVFAQPFAGEPSQAQMSCTLK